MQRHNMYTVCWLVCVFAGCSGKVTTEGSSDAKQQTAGTPSIAPIKLPESHLDMPADRMSTDAIDATLFVLREQLKFASPGKVCFVAAGYNDEGWIDLPLDAMKRIDAPDLELLPASASRIPPPNDTKSENDFPDVDHLETGDRSRVYHATITKWIDENTAEVAYGTYGGQIANTGNLSLIATKKNGRWTVQRYVGGGIF